jgi:hypothetical protein
MEYLYAPIYYKRLILSYEPLGYHMHHVKRPERVALNSLFYETKYFEIKEKQGEEIAQRTLKEYALKKYGTENLREIGLKIMKNEVLGKPCFDYNTLPNEVLQRAKDLGIPFGKCL